MNTLIGFVIGLFVGAAISLFWIALLTRGKEMDAYNAGYQAGYNKNFNNNERRQ